MASDGSQKLARKACDHILYYPGCGDIYESDSSGKTSGSPGPQGIDSYSAKSHRQRNEDRTGTWFGKAPTGSGTGLEEYVEDEESAHAADTGPQYSIVVDKTGLRHIPKVGCLIESQGDFDQVCKRKNGILYYARAGVIADYSFRQEEDYVVIHGSFADIQAGIESANGLPDMIVIDAENFEEAFDKLSHKVAIALSIGASQESASAILRGEKKPAAVVGKFSLHHNCRALLGLCRRTGVAAIAESPSEDEIAQVEAAKPIQELSSAIGVEPMQVYYRWNIQRGLSPILALAAYKETSLCADSALFAFSLSTKEKGRLDALAK